MIYFDYDKEPKRAIICIDCKSFYASCECVDLGLNPLEAMLVVLSGNEKRSGLILASSPMAKKKLNISNVTRFNQLPPCPELIKQPPRMDLYIKTNLKIVSILRRYVPDEDLHVYSIDEMFLDVTGCLNYFDLTVKELAKKIMLEILNETGIYTTAGIGDNPLLAKLALDNEAKHNPDMIGIWRYSNVPSKVWAIPKLTDFWGINVNTEKRLKQLKIYSVKDLALFNPYELKDKMGIIGQQLHAHANGIDRSVLSEKYKPKEKSISNSQILMRNYTKLSEVEIIIREMADLVGSRLRKATKKAKVIHLTVGYSYTEKIKPIQKQVSVDATSSTSEISEICLRIFRSEYKLGYAVRSVAISANQLVDGSSTQLSLFSEPEKQIIDSKLDLLVDEIRNKYGFESLVHASSLTNGATAISRSKKIGGH